LAGLPLEIQLKTASWKPQRIIEADARERNMEAGAGHMHPPPYFFGGVELLPSPTLFVFIPPQSRIIVRRGSSIYWLLRREKKEKASHGGDVFFVQYTVGAIIP
jgi:hypothetical protein